MAKSIIKKCISLLNIPVYKRMLERCHTDIANSDSFAVSILKLSRAYRLMKEISNNICSEKASIMYKTIMRELIECEDLLDETFIVDSNPNFDYYDSKFVGKSSSDFKTIIDKIEYIVWFTRTRLLDTVRDEFGTDVDFNKLHLCNQCQLSSNVVKLVCDTMGIKCEKIKLDPAFTNKVRLYNGNGFHYFNIVWIDNKKFIVDCTYRQFFRTDTNLIDRLGVLGLNGCYPGIYMMQNESRKKTALELLKNGYVEYTSENMKNYLDGFTLSYRNGLYYEWLGKVDYNVSYTLDDYKRFILGEDSLLNYEPVECLGVQEIPLNNYRLNFSKQK